MLHQEYESYLFLICLSLTILFQFTTRLASHKQQHLAQSATLLNVGILDTRHLRQSVSLLC